MNNSDAFQIVCVNCGCLSIKIDEPLKSSREAIVSCGDCGYARGTVGTLRDLAVQQHLHVLVAAEDLSCSANEPAKDELRPSNKISAQYAELRRLRERVKIAEWLANEAKASRRRRSAESITLQPSSNSDGLHTGVTC